MAISDIRKGAAEQCAANLGIREVYGEPESVIDHPDIDAVLICSSTNTHAALIEAAAAAGKHIFCEKPIDLDLARVDRVLATVEQAGVKLMVGFNRRFDHNFRRVRDLVEAGAIGTPQILHIISRDPAPPPIEYVKVSGGIFLDMTIHDFDMVRFLSGAEIVEVHAYGAVLVDPKIGDAGDVDTAMTTLRLSNGALAVIENSRQAVYGYDQRVEVFGSAGSAEALNEAPAQIRLSTADGVRSENPLYFFLERYQASFVAELEAFFTCVRDDTEPLVGGKDGLMSVAVGLAATRSRAVNRPVMVETRAVQPPGGRS